MSSRLHSADVLVIGAGVIGLSTALELLRAGLRVTVLERGAVGPGGASWAGGGILAPLEPNIDAGLRPLLRDSLAGYAAWCAELQADSGTDPEYLVSGLRVVAPGDAQAWSVFAADCGLEIQSGQAPDLLRLPGIAQVRSPRLLRALAQAVRHRGGVIEEGVDVHGLLGQARVDGVMTGAGARHAQSIVLAAGAWSGKLSAQARVRPVRGEMLLLESVEGELQEIVLRDGHYLIPRRGGGVVAGSTIEDIGFEHATSAVGRTRILDAVLQMMPALASRPVIAHWSGLRPGAEPVPQIGAVEGRPGLFLNCGHYRLGITLAPGSARVAAQAILSR